MIKRLEKGLNYLKILGGNILVSHFFYSSDDQGKNNDTSHFANMENYNRLSSTYVCTENLPDTDVDTLLSHRKSLDYVQL